MAASTLPRSLQALVTDAEACGMTVTVKQDDQSIDVFVTNTETGSNAGVTFTLQGVYPVGTLKGSRLGFYTTSPEKYVMKFSHGMGYSKSQGYVTYRSIRGARAVVGLEV